MAKPHSLDTKEPSEPERLSDRAIDNLRYIRETMERSSSFTAVPGYGGMLMGVTAIAAAYVASLQPTKEAWLIAWLAEATLAAAIGLLAMWQKSRIVGQSLFSAQGRKFAFGFAPPLMAGVAITLGLFRYLQYEVMVPVWMLCYGAAVVTGGAVSVKAVPIMGWLFITAGIAAFTMPSAFGNYFMAATFGLLHVIFGAIIARRYGG